ncbi:MAG: ATP-binding protein, partial [Campylobacterota bacterium]|nr:ATP-binding protein [Campylobacterota bacterium]
KDIISNIFEPYFTTKEEKGGTGLGLYISKMIVEKHLKGRLTVQNNENGACFNIVLKMLSNDDE